MYFIKFIRRCFFYIKLYLVHLFILVVKAYQKFISPLLGPRCRFNPTCSNYAIIALTRFGLIKGSWLTLKRVLKCHPLHEGGDDFVPQLKKDTNRDDTNGIST